MTTPATPTQPPPGESPATQSPGHLPATTWLQRNKLQVTAVVGGLTGVLKACQDYYHLVPDPIGDSIFVAIVGVAASFGVWGVVDQFKQSRQETRANTMAVLQNTQATAQAAIVTAPDLPTPPAMVQSLASKAGVTDLELLDFVEQHRGTGTPPVTGTGGSRPSPVSRPTHQEPKPHA